MKIRLQVTPSLFSLTAVAPLHGRLLSSEDINERPTRVVLGYDLWRARFGADPGVVGRVVDLPSMLGRQRLFVVGVMPPGFDFPDGTNVWSGLPGPPALNLRTHFARLAIGVTVDQVRTRFPRLTIAPLREHLRPENALALGVLLAATGLLLLVAWVQVAGLLFARAAGRTQELGLRLALGAPRIRLIRQFILEGLVVTVAALGLALLMTSPLTTAIVRLLPAEMTVGQVLTPDTRTLLFASGLSCAGLLFISVLPLGIVRRSSPLGLMQDKPFDIAQPAAARTRMVMLVGQLAVTATLLYMAGLAAHSFSRLSFTDLGFTPDDLVAITLPSVSAIPAGGVPATPEAIRALQELEVQQFDDMLAALQALPGVTAAAGGRVPLVQGTSAARQQAVTSSSAPGDEPFQAVLNDATIDYARVLGLRVREGRLPTSDEIQLSAPPALVNATLARRLAAYGPVVGQTLRPSVGAPIVVVGVVDDFIDGRPDQSVEPQIIAFRRTKPSGLLVKLEKWDDRTLAALKVLPQRIWPDMSPRQIVRLSDEAWRATSDYRARSTLLGLIALLCLPLAITGIAGALSYSVRQRDKELAVRMVLGAEPERIARGIVRRALACAAAGLGLGIAGGLIAGRWMSAYLFEVRPSDPLTMAAVGLLLLMTAWLSALWPASRAARTDPAVLLREG